MYSVSVICKVPKDFEFVFKCTSEGFDDSTGPFESGLFFSGAGLLNGLTIAIAFPLNVFLKERGTLLLLVDAEDFVDLESESESESDALPLLDLVGNRIG